MMRYHEALSRCLEAVAEGRNLESVIAEMPARHRGRLRQDASLADAVRRHAATVPAPSAAAEVNALTRLNAELSAVRASRESAPSRGVFLGLPRFALAGLALAALLVGVSFIVAPNRGNDGSVEAAEFEGVVVASGDGSLTVQTLDTLEEVMVPLDALVVDEDGAALPLGAIEAGEVVMIRGNREHGGPVHALDVRRLIDGLPGWCDENAERCRQVAQNLRDAQARCDQNPEACRLLRDRVTDVIARATDVADLEDLRARCRLSGGDGCRDFTSFCRDHADVCIRDIPPGPIVDRLEDAGERLHELDGLCNDRDTRACRQIAQLCEEHPVLCNDAPLRDAPIRDQRPSR
jgi:hypothetical protein